MSNHEIFLLSEPIYNTVALMHQAQIRKYTLNGEWMNFTLLCRPSAICT